MTRTISLSSKERKVLTFVLKQQIGAAQAYLEKTYGAPKIGIEVVGEIKVLNALVKKLS